LRDRLFAIDNPGLNRDGSLEPLAALRDSLREHGYDLRTIDTGDMGSASLLVFFGIPEFSRGAPYLNTILIPLNAFLRAGLRTGLRRWWSRAFVAPLLLLLDPYLKTALERGYDQKMLLMLWEPPVVVKNQYDQQIHRHFAGVLTWRDDLIDGKRYRAFRYPMPRRNVFRSRIPFAKKKLCTLISGNKHSTRKDELYSERERVIRFFERRHPNDFDLYGSGWNRPRNMVEKALPFLVSMHSAYRGRVDNKWKTLAKYRFCICYENMHGIKGYISEKIFDAFYGSCVPVYWGAENIADYIPPDAFIDRRRFGDDAELYAFLSAMDERTHRRYLDAAQRYLKSAGFKSFFSQDAFVHDVTDAFLSVITAVGRESVSDGPKGDANH